MILVDTSAWIDFFQAKKMPHVSHLEYLLRQEKDLCICGPILTEILQGIKSDSEFKQIQNLLDMLIFLPMDKLIFISAAVLYRKVRAQGKTIRNTVDCLIASCAIHHGVELLQNDRDFIHISGISKLKLSSR